MTGVIDKPEKKKPCPQNREVRDFSVFLVETGESRAGD
jgi:hypothetical protein